MLPHQLYNYNGNVCRILVDVATFWSRIWACHDFSCEKMMKLSKIHAIISDKKDTENW